MIQFSGYETLIQKVYKYKQEHVFAYWNELSESEKKSFLDELSSVDFASLNALYSSTYMTETIDTNFGPAPYISRPKTEKEKELWNTARSIGIDHIKKGKVAVFIVAGGQGSRLGFDGPKGSYRMSPVQNKSLFQIHAEKVKKYSLKYNVHIPLFIMTSDVNHAATVSHFEENNLFGLDRKDLFLFQQNMIPSLDTNGKLILCSKVGIFRNPDGHGGSLVALHT
ncbi:MAG TPA: UTP--glucose-1-phosphate uridylyltransferase, partial [Spirochaetota bacterium]